MSDKAMSDAIAALAKSQLLTVEVLRETQSATIAIGAGQREVVERLGQICDQNSEILKHIERLSVSARDSERAIRVVHSRLDDVDERLKPIEAAYQAAKQAAQ